MLGSEARNRGGPGGVRSLRTRGLFGVRPQPQGRASCPPVCSLGVRVGPGLPRVHSRRPLHCPPCARGHVLPTKPTAQAAVLGRPPGRVQPFVEVCPGWTLVTEAWTGREGRAMRELN